MSAPHPTTQRPMISFQAVDKWYGAYHALDRVTAQVGKGQVVVVCGPSGSGKSTLIRTVNRLEEVQGGRIEFDGQDVHAPGLDLNRFRSQVGFVFQSFKLFPHLSVAENIALAPVSVLKRSRRQARERTLEVHGSRSLAREGQAGRLLRPPPQRPGAQVPVRPALALTAGIESIHRRRSRLCARVSFAVHHSEDLMQHPHGRLFPDALQREIKDRFHFVDHDPSGRERLFFENAGGSLRLKSVTARAAALDAIPDCPERIHAMALQLHDIQQRGTDDVRTVLHARGGAVYASLTASAGMFAVVRAMAENVPGTNMVTTVLEHPSAYDAMSQYAERTGRELRVVPSNPQTGGIDVEEVVRRIDSDTCLLSVIFASNISGAKVDVEAIVRRTRAVKPDLFIVVDAVQHAPHGRVDLQTMPVDAINFAPYKFFGARGSGFTWLSDRTAMLRHDKLTGKQPDFWDLGSAAPWQFAAVTEIVGYVCWLGRRTTDSTDRRAQFEQGIDAIELHERALLHRLLEGADGVQGLRHMGGVKVHLDHPDLTRRDLILAIGIEGLDYTQAVREYEKRGVIVYERIASSIYSRRMLESFGMSGAIRVSPLHCHAPSDIDRFLRVTRQIAAEHRAAATPA